MKQFIYILIYFSFFSFRKSLKKSTIIDKSIDPSLYTQVNSYYKDLYKKIVNKNLPETLEDKSLKEEETNANRLIEELTQGFNKNKSQNTTNLINTNENTESLNKSLETEKTKNITIKSNNTAYKNQENSKETIINERNITNFNNIGFSLFEDHSFNKNTSNQELPKFLEEKPSNSERNSINQILPQFPGKKEKISEESFFAEKTQNPVFFNFNNFNILYKK